MNKWYEGDVIANGVMLHYHRTGGDKPALVIVHGITDMGIAWSRVARALEQDYDVIMYDRRGHGLSEKPETGYTFKMHAADLAALIAALDLERPRVIGHSSGAAAALFAAASHSGLMACLVLVDPAWGTAWGDWESVKVGMRQWFLGLGGRTRQKALVQVREENPDWIVTSADAQEMSGLWREGKIVQIDGAGHMVHYDRFDPFVEAVRAFLTDI